MFVSLKRGIQIRDGNNYPGIYVAFEGGEGCGKTTQQKLLEEELAERRGL